MLKSKFETLRDLIKKDIISGKYLPGMPLPTEGDLHRQFGANHSTINKAVAALSTEGFIRTKTRTGSVVLPIRERRLPARLGIYVMRSTGHIFDKLNSEVLNVLQRNYYFPLLVNLDLIHGDKNHDWLTAHLEEAIQSMPEFIVVDGQAGFPVEFFQTRVKDIENLIFVNRFESDRDLPSIKILSDYEQGGYLAARRLLDLGCGNIVVVLGMREVLHDDINISHAEIRGMRKALEEGGRNPAQLVFIARNDSDWHGRLKVAFAGRNSCDGILSDSDFTAYKTIQELNGLKISHGRDYRLVGYFDTPWASESESPFDTVSINQEGIAAKLHEIITKRKYEPRTWSVPPRLVINTLPENTR